VPAASRIAIAIFIARSAGSGHGTGSLKNTMMPSPENWSSQLAGDREGSHPSSAMSICRDWKSQLLSHQQVMNLT
jgi:hypothetical protein